MEDAVVNEECDEDVDDEDEDGDDEDDEDEWESAYPASGMRLEGVDVELPVAPAGKMTIVEITSNLLRQVEELENKLEQEKAARVATQAQLDVVTDAYANAKDRLAQLAAPAPAPDPPAPSAPDPPAPPPPSRPLEPSGPITAPYGYPHQAVWYCKGKAPPTGWKYHELRKTCRLIDHIYRRFPRKVVAAAGKVACCKAYEEATTTMTYNGCFCRRQGAQRRSRIFVNAAQFFVDTPGTAHNILCTIAHEYAHAVTYAEGNGLNHDDHFVRAEIEIRDAAFKHFYGERRRRLW